MPRPVLPPRLRTLTVSTRQRLRPVTDLVSPSGRAVVLVAVIAWLVGWRFGWIELTLVAATALVLLLACAVLTIGRTRLNVEIDLEPRRVVVGSPSAGDVRVTNAARGVLLPITLEFPVGPGEARFLLPALRSGATHEELFVVPTSRRGVVEIGPASTVRGDPLGLLQRRMQWSERIELFVHPVTVPLEPLGAGLLRDLEGQTTQDMSMSDLAFHALRAYAPGDDRRYIHWRSSAKRSSTTGGPDFLVRQFLDTRRSHFATVVDSDMASYQDAEDYEMAISVAASVAVRAVLDEQDLTVVAGAHALPSATGPRVLDTFSRAELGEHGLRDLAARAARISADTSIVLLITGARLPYPELHRAAAHFPPEVAKLAVRIETGRPSSLQRVSGLTVLSLKTLSGLPPALAGSLM